MKVFKAITGAEVGTHIAAEGTMMDYVNPFSLPADDTGAAVKWAIAAGIGWFGRGYRDNGRVSL